MGIQNVRHQSRDARRQRFYRRAILITIAGNGILALAKGLVAWYSGSSAVFSDAVNSLSDVLYGLLMAIGLSLACQPADEGHPQGHSRFEPLVSLFITAMLAVAGLTALQEAISRLSSGAVAIPAGWPTMVLVGSGLIKAAMFLLCRRIGRQARSPAIIAAAQDNLGDMLSSAGALVGVWGSQLIHPLLDPVAGIVISLWVFRLTWEILSENMGYLTGRGASPELRAKIIEVASSVTGVLGVHQVIADHVGPRLRVDIHIDVDGEITLCQAHAIADQVCEAIEALPPVDLAFVHAEPAPDPEGWRPDSSPPTRGV